MHFLRRTQQKIPLAFMKAKMKPVVKIKSISTTTPAERGFAAAKAMNKELIAEHRRWNMPLLTWKNGKVVEDRRHLRN